MSSGWYCDVFEWAFSKPCGEIFTDLMIKIVDQIAREKQGLIFKGMFNNIYPILGLIRGLILIGVLSIRSPDEGTVLAILVFERKYRMRRESVLCMLILIPSLR